jgi:hypothetical protein
VESSPIFVFVSSLLETLLNPKLIHSVETLVALYSQCEFCIVEISVEIVFQFMVI